MIDNEENMLPPSRPGGWKVLFAAFAVLAITGVTLSLLYRDAPKRSAVIQKQRTKNATKVVYTVVLSQLDQVTARQITDSITADIGADSVTTDLVVGSTVSDPWCASIGEYRAMLLKSMSETKTLSLGKQTLLISMVTGLMTKVSKPSTLYLVGELNGDNVTEIGARTAESASAMQIVNELMGSVRIVSYLRPANKPIHQQYVRLFQGKTYPVEIR